MTAAQTRHPFPYILINDLPYALARTAGGVSIWRPQQFQTQEGDPTSTQRFRWNDWGRGMGDSRGMARGSVEMSSLCYLGAPGRLLPGPATTVLGTAHSATVKSFVDVTLPAPRVIAFGGVSVVEINPVTKGMSFTTLGGGDLGPCQIFDSQVAVALGDTTNYVVRSPAGTYAANTFGKKARCFGKSGSRLVRGYLHNWSSCDSAEITSVDNWSVDYPIAGAESVITQVFGHNRWDYVLKTDGFYTFDEETSAEANILTDLEHAPSAENRSFGQWFDFVFLCTRSGLYRCIQQGAARTVGPEEITINENVMKGAWPTAFAAFGHWGYAAFYDGTTTWLTRMRRSREGDLSMGSPFVIVDVLDVFPGECRAIHITGLSGTPELYYGRANNVGYCQLTINGLPVAYRTDGGTMYVEMPPTDLGQPMTIKQFQSLEIIGRNAAAGRTFQAAARMDEGVYANVGAVVNSLTNGYAKRSWTRGVNDSGRVIQMRATLTNDHATLPIEVRDMTCVYESRPVFVEGAVVGLQLRDFYTEGDVADRRTAKEARLAIEAHLDGAIVTVTDPWGDTYPARLAAYQGDPVEQLYGEELQVDVAFGLRRLDY